MRLGWSSWVETPQDRNYAVGHGIVPWDVPAGPENGYVLPDRG